MERVINFDFSKTPSQSLIVHSVRIIFLALVLLITIAFQVLETRIVSFTAFFPIYLLIGFSFFFQSLYFAFYRNIHQYRWISAGLFVVEAFYVTGLIYFVGIEQSLLVFLYLVNIILCGMLFQRKGALLLALLTSVLFSFILSLEVSLQGPTAYLAVGVNNLAFFTVAYLSGYLSEQLNIMGMELQARTKDLRVLKNLNELILSNMNSGLMTIDTEGLVIQVNPLAINLVGQPQSMLIGRHVRDIFPGFSLKKEGIGKGTSFDYRFRSPGQTLDLRMHLSRLVADQGRSRGYILTFQDETMIRDLEKRVRQSEKLAAIGTLAAGIAHEIRNPLASISGSIQMMESQGADADESQKLMRIVIKEINRLNNLITEFLDYARPEAPKEDTVVLKDLIKEIIDFSSMQAGVSHLNYDIDADEGLSVLGNRDKLRQAFLNIIVNAVQAMGDQADPKLSVKIEKTAKGLIVDLKDNGCGIGEEQLAKIFEPFHTTKPKGTGLGLAITYSIFESHGAHIEVESQLGEGTGFKVTFPN